MVGRHSQYQGDSKRIKEFLGYGVKESSNEAYMRCLTIFEGYLKTNQLLEVDDCMVKLETGEMDVYKFFADYLRHLIKIGNEPSTIKNRISVAKLLVLTITHPTVSIDPRRFKYFVKMPKIIKKEKKGLSKETVIQVINACVANSRLRLIMLFLAATSCRIGETLLLRISDLHLDGEPKFGLRPPFLPYISIRGETTKTGQDRTVLLTSEITEQLGLWISNKYKIRNKITRNAEGKNVTQKYKPERHLDDYLFMDISHGYNESDAARFVYKNLDTELHSVLENVHLDQRTKKKLYAISFHKIRMGVRTRISDLGFKQSKEFGDFYMGHDTSTYYQPTDDAYKTNFLLCQNELTYLDQTSIQKSYGGIETRIDKVEDTTIMQLKEKEKELNDLNTSIILQRDELQILRQELKEMRERDLDLQKIKDEKDAEIRWIRDWVENLSKRVSHYEFGHSGPPPIGLGEELDKEILSKAKAVYNKKTQSTTT